jgi:CRISPR system Cascade subunit CasE
MIFSQLLPNPHSRQVQKELANPYEMHRTIMSAFPQYIQEKDRVLYRLDIQDREPYLDILVQSTVSPDWSELEQKDYLLAPVQTKQAELQFVPGQLFQYKLHANPTKRSKDEKTKGKRLLLQQTDDQTAWIQRKALNNGFNLESIQISPLSIPHFWKHEDGVKREITLGGVCFEGLLTVTDPPVFTSAVTNGIGSAKGFGFGLLSLKRYNSP